MRCFDETSSSYGRHQSWMVAAAQQAMSSTCRKSRRGAVLVKEDVVIGAGSIQAKLPELCDPCVRAEKHGTYDYLDCPALHAEEMALLDALSKGHDPRGGMMYHVKLLPEPAPHGNWAYSHRPGCRQCARLLAHYDVRIVLNTREGCAVYGPEEHIRCAFGLIGTDGMTKSEEGETNE